MKKFANYINNGRGIGFIVILFASVIFSAYHSMVVRKYVIDAIPYIQTIADEILPLEIDNGTVVSPYDINEAFPLYSDEIIPEFNFNVKTNVDTLDTAKLKSGIYLTRSHFYIINNEYGQMEAIKLKGNLTILKKDYTQTLRANVKWLTIFYAILFIFSSCFMYFILTLFYAFCSDILVKISNKDMHFSQKMRLSAICLTATLFLSLLLTFINLSMNIYMFFLTVIALQLTFIKKYFPA